MKNYYTKNTAGTKAAYCTDEGIVIVEDLIQNQILFENNILGDGYKYLLYELDVKPFFEFSSDEEWLIVTYRGYFYCVELVYFVELASGKIIRKNYYTKNTAGTKAVYCTEEGIVIVDDLIQNQILFEINIFGDRYKYLLHEWEVKPYFKFSPDEEWLIVTYGIGYIYFVELASGKICKSIRLFEDVDYGTDSFKNISTCCYADEHTRIDFSKSGRYMAARVRGDFDPQDSDGREIMFEPIFFRSVFVFDMQTKELVFEYSYSEGEHYRPMSLGTIAFSPDDKLFVTGVFGGQVKVFDLLSQKEIACFEELEWISAPCDIDDRQLVVFLNNNEFLFVNRERELVHVASDTFGNWYIKSKIVREKLTSFDIVYDIEYDSAQNIIKCDAGRKEPIYNVEL